MPDYALERDIIFIILDSKHICLFLCREIPSLSSKAVFCTNIFKKVVCNKGFCSQDMNDPWRFSLITSLRIPPQNRNQVADSRTQKVQIHLTKLQLTQDLDHKHFLSDYDWGNSNFTLDSNFKTQKNWLNSNKTKMETILLWLHANDFTCIDLHSIQDLVFAIFPQI